jgi:hypothetical protein
LKSHGHFDARGLQPSSSDSQRAVMSSTSQPTPMFTTGLDFSQTNGLHTCKVLIFLVSDGAGGAIDASLTLTVCFSGVGPTN